MGGQYHHELMKYCPPSYVLCVSSHFWPFNIVKFVLEKLDKNLGSADPPPQLGRNPKFFQKLDLRASLIFQTKTKNYEKRFGMHDLEIHNVLLLFPCSRSPHFCFTGQHRKVKSKVKKLKCVAQYVIM